MSNLVVGYCREYSLRLLTSLISEPPLPTTSPRGARVVQLTANASKPSRLFGVVSEAAFANLTWHVKVHIPIGDETIFYNATVVPETPVVDTVAAPATPATEHFPKRALQKISGIH